MSNQPTETTRRKKWRLRIALVLGGLAISVLIGEAGLRVAGISYQNFYQTDPHRGTALRPGAEGWCRKEGEAFVRINSAGFRDRERPIEKPKGSLRIAVLGDSYTEARQVCLEETFCSVLERELSECVNLAGREIEVFNFGVSGYGTAQELLTMRHAVWETRPDVILLLFTSGNDVRNNSRVLDGEPMRPYFVIEGDELILDDSFLESRGYRARQTPFVRLVYHVIEGSRILQAVNRVKNVARARREVKRQGGNGTDRGTAEAVGEIGLDNTVYREPDDDAWREAWAVTERIIIEMRNEAAAHGAEFRVVTGTNGIQVNPDPDRRRAYAARHGVDDLAYPDERIRSLGEREGFPVLNLAPSMTAFAEEKQVYLHGFENTGLGRGHWNAEGHRLAGELIARDLCASLAP